jgi:ABC-type transport system substrate-binding protein
MFETLLGIDLKGNVQPNLAVSWEVQESGRVYLFSLRRGVKFHDGQRRRPPMVGRRIELHLAGQVEACTELPKDPKVTEVYKQVIGSGPPPHGRL